MGMYDYVDFECECPGCGATVEGFQSKDGPCEMAYIEPAQLRHWYTWCDQCGLWIDCENVPVKTKLVITVGEFMTEDGFKRFPKQAEARRRLSSKPAEPGGER